MTKKQRRPQTPKPRNEALNRANLELRQGSRTTPVPSGKVYRRPAPGRKWE